MIGKNRRQVHFDQGSSEFDSIVNVGDLSTTIPASQVFRGLMQSSPSKEISLTFPSAAELIAACPVIPVAGYCKRFSIRNDGKSGITLVAGEGGSINGSGTVSASNYAARYVLRFTSVTSGVEAYQLIRE